MNDKEKWEFGDVKQNKIDDILQDNETVLYRTQPKKSAYIWSAVLKMLPMSILWLLVDCGFIVIMFVTNDGFSSMADGIIAVICIFFAFHLTPVWIWLGGIIKAALEYKNIDYAFTDKRIIIRNGIFGIDFKSILYSEIDSIDVKVGAIDRILKVGDLYIKHAAQTSVVYDIHHPYGILTKLQKVTLDIKSDIQYPNDLRPSTNHGYDTKYED